MLDADGGLLRGTLDLLILKALSWGPRHGYAVAEWVHAITDGDLLVEEGPLYTALHRLERQGWLVAEWGYSDNNRKAKYYHLSRERPYGTARRADSLAALHAGGRQGYCRARTPGGLSESMRRAFRLGLGPDHLATEVDDELAFHVEMRSRKLMAMGFSAEAARREALRQFGDLQHVRASCVTLDEERERSMKRIRYADELRQDIGFALRALRRNPGFTAVAVFTLALGIGANTAIFTLINAILLRPIPVVAPQQLIALGIPSRINSMSHGTPQAGTLLLPALSGRSQQQSAGDRLARHPAGRIGSMCAPMRAELRSSTRRDALSRATTSGYSGIPAARGRVFGALEDSIAGASPAVVISDRYWTRRFARDQQVVGRTLVVDNVVLTIIGVTPPGFSGEIVDRPTDLWIPITMQPLLQPHLQLLDDRHVSWLLLLGRLAPRRDASPTRSPGSHRWCIGN